jgi:hypothetical protein
LPNSCARYDPGVRLPIFLILCASTTALADPPRAARRPVKDTYHGVTVVDPYRWLENGADPEVRAWTRAVIMDRLGMTYRVVD